MYCYQDAIKAGMDWDGWMNGAHSATFHTTTKVWWAELSKKEAIVNYSANLHVVDSYSGTLLSLRREFKGKDKRSHG